MNFYNNFDDNDFKSKIDDVEALSKRCPTSTQETNEVLRMFKRVCKKMFKSRLREFRNLQSFQNVFSDI